MSFSASSCFSALQRAENSSIARQELDAEFLDEFQCSSASRKFLNQPRTRTPARHPPVSVLFSEPKIPQFARRWLERVMLDGFSALQRAENSSIVMNQSELAAEIAAVSVLFSEPKIPQSVVHPA